MDDRVRQYLDRLRSLFDQVRSWLEGDDILLDERTVQLNEEGGGRYDAPRLILAESNGNAIAALVPIGAYIIGAGGRVDLRGTIDTVPILYLLAGGGSLRSRVSSAGGRVLEEHVRPVFQDVVGEGWYTVGDKRPRSARPLTRERFLQLLRQVSDYEHAG